MRLPIVAGQLAGMWWDPASGGKLLRVLGGTYEREQTALFVEHVRRGATVLDIGAHVGYYSLLAARLGGRTSTIVAYEPDRRNAGRLRRHLRLNRLERVAVVEAAVAEHGGSAQFARGTGSGTGHLASQGGVTVRTVRLDDEAKARRLRPDVLKIDVEGAEIDVLRGGLETLRRARPVLFLSTHGPQPHAECIALLGGLGYTFRPILGDDVATSSELLCLP
jgi:FkbM family methyltransferase